MKKTFFKNRAIKILCFLLAVLILSDAALFICRNHDNNSTLLTGFYREPDNSLDVVVLGASDVFAGYSACHAYDRYGITSYPYASDALPSSLYLPALKEILRTQNPQWIVIEINGMLYETQDTRDSVVRRFLDNIPFSRNKLETIFQVAPKEDLLNYLVPFIKYHGNWKLNRDRISTMLNTLALYIQGQTYLKGCCTSTSLCNGSNSMDLTEDFSTASLYPEFEEDLRELIHFCQEQQLTNVIFTRFPHIVSTDQTYSRYQRCNEAQKIIEQAGYTFLHFERDPRIIDLDVTTDYYNGEHLNLLGQQKLTEYLCQYLMEEKGLSPMPQSEKQQENWAISAQRYYLFCDYIEEQKALGNKSIVHESRGLIRLLDARK